MEILTGKIRGHIERGIIDPILQRDYDQAIKTIPPFYGLGDYRKVKEVLPWFESAAASPEWKLREFAQMFFIKIIKNHPNEIQGYLLGLVQSDNANLRRFVSETLRPVQENRWFYKNPDYPLSVLRYLFKVRHPVLFALYFIDLAFTSR